MLNCSENRAQFYLLVFFQITWKYFHISTDCFCSNSRVRFTVDSFVWGLGEHRSLNGCFIVTEKCLSVFASSENDLFDKFKMLDFIKTFVAF